jgi:hypothetical protein
MIGLEHLSRRLIIYTLVLHNVNSVNSQDSKIYIMYSLLGKIEKAEPGLKIIKLLEYVLCTQTYAQYCKPYSISKFH